MDIQIAERLQALRKEHGYSQEQLADELGVSRQAVSKWERGEASPDTDNLIALAKLYGVTVDEVLFNKSLPQPAAQAETERRQRGTEASGAAAGIAVMLCCIAYFIMGGVWGLWHPGWIIFLAIPLAPTLTEAIVEKDPNQFAFPVIVVAAYLLSGFLADLWHPMWVLFLTIPVYYIAISFFKKK